MPLLTIELSRETIQTLEQEARAQGMTPQRSAAEIVEQAVAPAARPGNKKRADGLQKLQAYLEKVPAVSVVSVSEAAEAHWWIKLDIDIHHDLAWTVVQELGHVLNYISLNERLPTVFKPVSPPPYMNGGPEDFLSWVIEAEVPSLDASYIAEVLEGRLPRLVEEEDEWEIAGDEDQGLPRHFSVLQHNRKRPREEEHLGRHSPRQQKYSRRTLPSEHHAGGYAVEQPHT